jgi:hypothetical protein
MHGIKGILYPKCGKNGTGQIGIFKYRAIHLSEKGETSTRMTLSSRETFSYVL